MTMPRKRFWLPWYGTCNNMFANNLMAEENDQTL